MLRIIAVFVLMGGGGLLGAFAASMFGLSGVGIWICAIVGGVLGFWWGATMRRPWDVVGDFVIEVLFRMGRSIGRNSDIDLS